MHRIEFEFEFEFEVEVERIELGLGIERRKMESNQNNKGFFAAMTSGLSMFGNAMHRSING